MHFGHLGGYLPNTVVTEFVPWAHVTSHSRLKTNLSITVTIELPFPQGTSDPTVILISISHICKA